MRIDPLALVAAVTIIAACGPVGRSGPPSGESGPQPAGHSSQTPLPENTFIGTNFARYMNADFDALVDRYFATIPKDERVTVAGQIAQHVAENLVLMGLFYQAEPTMIGNRLRNVHVEKTGGSTHTGNAHEWDLR